MSRQIKVEDEDWGEYELFVLWEDEEKGTWKDEEWEEVRRVEEVQPLIDLFSRVSWESYEDALHGNPIHLIRELNLPPKDCLIKSDLPLSKCIYHKECPAYDAKDCFGHKNPPPCFSPTIEDESFQVRETVGKIYEYWQNGIWIVIVQEDQLR